MSLQCVGGAAHPTTSEQYKSGHPAASTTVRFGNMIATPLHRLPDRYPAIGCSVRGRSAVLSGSHRGVFQFPEQLIGVSSVSP